MEEIREIQHKMKALVVEKIIKEHDILEQDAIKYVEESVFNKMLEIDIDYVGHYSAKYWAEDIVQNVISE